MKTHIMARQRRWFLGARSKCSDLTGASLEKRLSDIGWCPADFCRFACLSEATVKRYMNGSCDGKIPVVIERTLELAEAFPEKLILASRSKKRTGMSLSRRLAMAQAEIAQIQRDLHENAQ